LRQSDYGVNALNQYTSRTVPGYVDVLGQASTLATVTVNHQRAERQGAYYREELVVTNTSGPVWQGITNLAVLNQGTNPDRIATNIGNLFVPGTPETFAYDLDGNVTNDGRWSYSWDAENRVTSFTRSSDAPSLSRLKVDCAYDYRWRRTQKIVSTWNGSAYVAQSTNQFIYDGWNLVAVLSSDLSPLLSFTWGSDASGSLQGAGGVGGLLSLTVHQGTNAGTYFYCFDGNHNVTALVSAADGSVVARYEYDAFGQVLRATGPLAFVNPFTFSTKFCDWETGFLYYGYRYYDASAGRWLGRDPLGERGGVNLYGFVGNNSVTRIDILGLADFRNHMNIGMAAMNRAGIKLNPKQAECFRRGLMMPDMPFADVGGVGSTLGSLSIAGGAHFALEQYNNAGPYIAGVKEFGSALADNALDLAQAASPVVRAAVWMGQPVVNAANTVSGRIGYWWNDFDMAGPILAHIPIIGGTETVRTHWGNLAYRHGMGTTGMSAETVQANLVNEVDKLLRNFRAQQQSDCCRAYLELGKALHALADSWAGGHVVRVGDGSIQWLQDYNRQSLHFHEAQDAMSDANAGNYVNAILQSTLMIQQAVGNGPIDSSGFFQLAPDAAVGTPPGTEKASFWNTLWNGYPGER
jgi:RHS repeat-associated protein